ncbi:hypothetical protein TNCV_3522961 [Trichonephila clavipes]|uniref:Uncharacterized protein n=1 Tax=Trichonephila clavipes TaxID=2585209 RepID=A0A8X6W8W2_TRICX|nr:hypothetical protein TNCV_3522961 [Trichonephila clavipes]
MNSGHRQRNGVTLYLLTNPASACNQRWLDWNSKTQCSEAAELLSYASPHWSCTRYHGFVWYWISQAHPSRTHCQYTELSALHFRGVGARGPPIHSALAIGHISTG